MENIIAPVFSISKLSRSHRVSKRDYGTNTKLLFYYRQAYGYSPLQERLRMRERGTTGLSFAASLFRCISDAFMPHREIF